VKVVLQALASKETKMNSMIAWKKAQPREPTITFMSIDRASVDSGFTTL
jgi:hypothetical protein